MKPKTGIELIAAERRRQKEKEKWSLAHDRECHTDGELASAAAVYALSGAGWKTKHLEEIYWPTEWDFKPKDPIRDLVRAGALIAAELDRLQSQREGKQ